MPAFTFEKISPPQRRGPAAPVVQKPRGLIAQILDRFAGARVNRSLGEENGSRSRRHRNSPDWAEPH